MRGNRDAFALDDWQPGDPLFPTPTSFAIQVCIWCRECNARWYRDISICPNCDRGFTTEDRIK